MPSFNSGKGERGQDDGGRRETKTLEKCMIKTTLHFSPKHISVPLSIFT